MSAHDHFYIVRCPYCDAQIGEACHYISYDLKTGKPKRRYIAPHKERVDHASPPALSKPDGGK